MPKRKNEPPLKLFLAAQPDILRRALDIHNENRSVFDFGPPPFYNEMEVKCPTSGSTYRLRISAHIPAKMAADAVMGLLDSATKSEKPVEAIRFGLAYAQAATNEVEAQFAAYDRGDQ